MRLPPLAVIVFLVAHCAQPRSILFLNRPQLLSRLHSLP
jgi:hypothetical protein